MKEITEELEVLKTNFGMWMFLATEVLIFGVLIMLFEINLLKYRPIFLEGSNELHFYHGTVNTLVLLTSSYFVALAQVKGKRSLLVVAMLLGVAFLFIKGSEYRDLLHEGKLVLNLAEDLHPQKKLFFTFYGFMTMLHALHVIVGIILLGLVWVKMEFRPEKELQENVGLYWHFVDLVWVYLYPLFYLLGH